MCSIWYAQSLWQVLSICTISWTWPLTYFKVRFVPARDHSSWNFSKKDMVLATLDIHKLSSCHFTEIEVNWSRICRLILSIVFGTATFTQVPEKYLWWAVIIMLRIAGVTRLFVCISGWHRKARVTQRYHYCEVGSAYDLRLHQGVGSPGAGRYSGHGLQTQPDPQLEGQHRQGQREVGQ